jgi:hypothetical protein
VVTVKTKIPVAILEYFKEYGGHLLTGLNLTIEITSPNAFEICEVLTKRFRDKLLVPSIMQVNTNEEWTEVNFGEWKIIRPKSRIEILPIDNFEVEKFAEFLKKEYKLERIKVEKELDEFRIIDRT